LSLILTILESSDLAREIRTSSLIYPLINATHIVGFSTLIGAIIYYDLTVLGLLKEEGSGALSVAKIGIIIAILTGILLFIPRASHYVENIAFLFKLGLLIMAAINIGLYYSLKKYTAVKKACAGCSIFLWILVIYAGRWIGFL